MTEVENGGPSPLPWGRSRRTAPAEGASTPAPARTTPLSFPRKQKPPFQATGHKPHHPVTTGLVPVVHAILRHPMDCRDKPGNDGRGEWGASPLPGGEVGAQRRVRGLNTGNRQDDPSVIPTKAKTSVSGTRHNPLPPSPPGSVPVVHGILRHPMDCRDKPGNDGDGGWGAFTSAYGKDGAQRWVRKP